MKIFIVSFGEYSDYCIAAIFSTREKAQRYAKEFGTKNEIDEYLVDEQDNKTSRMAFITHIDLETGEIIERQRHQLMATAHERSRKSDMADFRKLPRGTLSSPLFGRLTAKTTSFVSEAHSLKLAAEARQKYLREKAVTP